jgi:hypothetical protein
MVGLGYIQSFMSEEKSIGALRKEIEKMTAKFVACLEEGKPFTVILTTDGETHRITSSIHPLPSKYLTEWENDRTN